ncbi:trypsin-like peptidase domain-containing protein [Streptomyces sp. MS2.AVA.5]|uniref:Trypsin-like peptidase domain-containing protein n=1 Tax=Streptomyces achmelvichensis TaxID=3134111 RepID=A0ACC6Q0V1_9ACTN
MDDGKPTGPKAKWWSRPSAGRAAHGESETQQLAPVPVAASGAGAESPTAAEPVGAEVPEPVAGPVADPVVAPVAEPVTAPVADPVTATVPEQQRPQPLHEPDVYSTPPYGGPGPWAPAPPVQRPAPTPAQGTPVPPQYAAPQGPGQAIEGGAFAPPAHQQTPPPAPPHAQPDAQPQAPGAPHPHPHAQPDPHSAHHPQPPHQPQPHGAHHPQAQAQGAHQQPSLWLQYDPWSAPGAAPLTHPGEPPKKRSRRGSLLVGALVVALLAGGIGGGIGAYIERNGGITQVELQQAPRDNGDRAPDSVAGIASSALPSVVTLHVSGGGEQGTGTGFVLDEQGHILTNNHVVDPAGAAGEISVTFSGGETAKATLVGKDSGYDLAVVKVAGVSGLKPLPLGNSDSVQVGDPVVAIGAPFDLQNTVTSGIISAKERPITAGGEKGDGSDVSYVDALQTDAPINPGNSGGPLVDTKARVIGINSAIRAADTAGAAGGQAGSIGLGFAIPINQGKRVAEELINTGKATHPVIGVSLDMKYTGDGARVGEKGKDGSGSVSAGGPAAKAGIKAGDVITKVDGQRVHSGEELIVKIRSHRPGDRLELTVVRAGKERTMTLTLGSADGA